MTLSALLLPSRGVEWDLFSPPAENLKSNKEMFLEILGCPSRGTAFLHTRETGITLDILCVINEKHNKQTQMEAQFEIKRKTLSMLACQLVSLC